MHIKRIIVNISLLTTLLMFLASCRTSSSSMGGEAGAPSSVGVDQLVSRISNNHSQQQYLTAKLKIEAQADGEKVSTSGTLRMKRDDVIQLILVDPLIGALELGRMEFTQTKVLIIDKVNKQYIDLPYAEVPFLERAGITFATLQSLFWNQLFTQGATHPSATDFKLTTQGADYVLTHVSKLLSYQFTVQPKTAHITNTHIVGTDASPYKFDFFYNDFQDYQGRPFPRNIVMSFTNDITPTSLSMTLSSLRNSSDWIARSTPSSRYTKADPEQILKRILK